jgi:hypothetical protein
MLPALDVVSAARPVRARFSGCFHRHSDSHGVHRGLVGSAMMFELVSWAEANMHDQTCAMEEACVPLLKSGIDRGGGGGGGGGGEEGVTSIEDDEVSEAGSGLTEDTVLGAGAGGGGGKGRGRGGGGRGGGAGGAGGGGGRGFGSADAIAANSKRLLDELKSLEGQAKYKEMMGKRGKLPAHQMREDVVAACRSNQILLVCGSTGCGKTTQVRDAAEDGYVITLDCRILQVLVLPRHCSWLPFTCRGPLPCTLIVKSRARTKRGMKTKYAYSTLEQRCSLKSSSVDAGSAVYP